jgi:hypothetical protein
LTVPYHEKPSHHLLKVLALLKSANEHHRWQQLDDAERIATEAVDLAKLHLGETHTAYGHALADLGTIQESQGRPFEARETLTRALMILEAKLGNQDASVLSIFSHLHQLYR